MTDSAPTPTPEAIAPLPPLTESGEALRDFVTRAWALRDSCEALARACQSLGRELDTAVHETVSDAALTRRLHEEETRLAALRQRTTAARAALEDVEETVQQQRDHLATLEAQVRATRDQLRSLQPMPILGG